LRGQAVARLETEAILGALVRHAATIEMTAEPTRRLNNTLRGFDSLPLRVVPL
jgi:cytochrome P450